MKNQLYIAVIGTTNEDSSLYTVLREIFQKIIQEKIPCAFLTEDSYLNNLDDQIQNLQVALNDADKVNATLPTLKELYSVDSMGNSHLSRIHTLTVRTEISQKFVPIYAPNIYLKPELNATLTGIAELAIFEEQSNREKIKLLKQLKRNHISVAGYTTEENKPSNPEEEKVFYQKEPSRVRVKAEKSIEHISNFISTGGILIILTLPFRSRQLGAHIKNSWKKQFPATPLEIQTINYLSDSAKIISSYIQTIERLIPQETPAFQDLINSLPHKIVTGEVKKTQSVKNFSIPELNLCIDQFISLYQNGPGIAGEPPKAPCHIYNLFSPPCTHDALLREIEKKLPQQTNTLKAMRNKDYSLVLRNLCSFGETELVRLFLEVSRKFSINLFAKSSNGKTAADWFAASKANEEDKEEIAALFEEKIAAVLVEKTNDELPKFFFKLQ